MNVLAVDDGGFYSSFNQDFTLLVAVTMDQRLRIHDLRINVLKIDGLDATEKVRRLVIQSRFKLSALLLPSACLAGFNIVALKDMGEILPTIVVNPRLAKMQAVEAALKKHFQDSEKRLAMLRQAGAPEKHRFYGGSCAVYYAGSSNKKVAQLLNMFVRVGATPEPLRIARLVAQGLTLRPNVGKV